MQRATFFAVLLITICASHALAREITWHDATEFAVEGRGWDDAATPFVRLPDDAQGKVNDTAWRTSRSSAGMALRFVTDAATVHVRWSLTSENLDMGHMPATGVSGIDLYTRTDDGWRFAGNGRPAQQDGNTANFTLPGDAQHECLLYLPLYNGTKSLEIGVESDDLLEPPTDQRPKPVVVYGTSIAQGGCASRPGMAWPAILGRDLDRPVINLGFSGSGDMAPPVGDVLAELDPAAYIIDCIWNMGGAKATFNERVTALVKSIRAVHPTTPIIFVGQSMISPNAHPTEMTTLQAIAVQQLQGQGVEGLILVPGRDLIGDDGEGTVDGVHMTDLGMQRQADALLPIVRAAIDEKQ